MPRIKVTRNGPYLVYGPVRLSEGIIASKADDYRMVPGRVFRLTGTYALCRCGRSGQKPFCDGSHGQHAFDGQEKASDRTYRDCAEKIEGPGLILSDVVELCALSRFCHTHNGTAWELTERSADPAARAAAIKAAAECPAGRLVAQDPESGQPFENAYEPSIVVIEDPEYGVSGPLWVKGGIPVESADGNVYEIRNRITLCRCGHSQNKPFCDASHVHVYFHD